MVVQTSNNYKYIFSVKTCIQFLIPINIDLYNICLIFIIYISYLPLVILIRLSCLLKTVIPQTRFRRRMKDVPIGAQIKHKLLINPSVQVVIVLSWSMEWLVAARASPSQMVVNDRKFMKDTVVLLRSGVSCTQARRPPFLSYFFGILRWVPNLDESSIWSHLC